MFTETQGQLLLLLARAAIARESWQAHGAIIRVGKLEDAIPLIDRVAPEHLELAVQEPRVLAEKIRHAGAIFMGHYTSESLGDYCAGPNHVLPTSGSARFSSPLGVYDFQKRTSLIRVSQAGSRILGRIASTLAHGEGLSAHAQSAEYRVKS